MRSAALQERYTQHFPPGWGEPGGGWRGGGLAGGAAARQAPTTLALALIAHLPLPILPHSRACRGGELARSDAPQAQRPIVHPRLHHVRRQLGGEGEGEGDKRAECEGRAAPLPAPLTYTHTRLPLVLPCPTALACAPPRAPRCGRATCPRRRAATTRWRWAWEWGVGMPGAVPAAARGARSAPLQRPALTPTPWTLYPLSPRRRTCHPTSIPRTLCPSPKLGEGT